MPGEDPVIDTKYMERCLALALQAEGRTAPNPVVGAVVLDKDGNVIGEGYHARAGQAHAEVVALQVAGYKARGGTLYVNLEPCCHYGRTGPCTEAVTASGVSRVVVGMRDPNPKVGGNGIGLLRARGISVDLGVLQEECAWANRGFLTRINKGRPWVCLKLASTLDGHIADRHGQSRWISGPEARQYVQALRNTFDCVLVGYDTAKVDDPLLTVREVENGRNPHRAVLDANLNMSPDARMFQLKEDRSKTFLFCSKDAEHLKKLQSFPMSVSILRVRSAEDDIGRLDLAEVMKALVAQEINSVLCEGGGTIAGALLAAKLVDEVNWIVAPKILNDAGGISALRLSQDVSLDEALTLQRVRISQLGTDVLIAGTVGSHDFILN